MIPAGERTCNSHLWVSAERVKFGQLSVIVFHGRLIDRGHRFVLRILIHEEEIEFGKGSHNPAAIHFPAVVRIHRTSSGTKKARTDSKRGPSNTWRMFTITYSLISSSSDLTSKTLSQSRLFGHPYRHISPKTMDKLPLDIETLLSAYRGSPLHPLSKCCLSWCTLCVDGIPSRQGYQCIFEGGHIPRVPRFR